MNTSFKYRIYPTKAQSQFLEKCFGCVRYVYNWGIQTKRTSFESGSGNVSYNKMSGMLTDLKTQPGMEWLSDPIAQCLQTSLRNLDGAYAAYFQKRRDYPKFKKKWGTQTISISRNASVGESCINIPKVGSIKATISRPVNGEVRSMCISKTPTGKYFVSVLLRADGKGTTKTPTTERGTIGIDLGLKSFATLSTGEKISNPQYLNRQASRLRRSQRKIARMRSGGSNRNKQRLRIAIIHERVANARKDFLHKLTTKLVRDNQTDTFAIEDLAVKRMLKNRHISNAISDTGWAEFRRMLQYKSDRAGKNVLAIGRFEPSSKACTCGIINNRLRSTDRTWSCVCGLIHDRDFLASCNIKKFALDALNRSIPPEGRELTLEEIAQ